MVIDLGLFMVIDLGLFMEENKLMKMAQTFSFGARVNRFLFSLILGS